MSNQKLILALLGAGMLGEAFESYRFAMDASDETTKTNLQSWVLSEFSSNVTHTMVLNPFSLSSLVVMSDQYLCLPRELLDVYIY
jgi:hypothetical protein